MYCSTPSVSQCNRRHVLIQNFWIAEIESNFRSFDSLDINAKFRSAAGDICSREPSEAHLKECLKLWDSKCVWQLPQPMPQHWPFGSMENETERSVKIWIAEKNERSRSNLFQASSKAIGASVEKCGVWKAKLWKGFLRPAERTASSRRMAKRSAWAKLPMLTCPC